MKSFFFFLANSRGALNDYTLPGYPNITIKKGETVFFNIAGIHFDPKYYPEPEKFIPERFSKEEKAKRSP